jgi:hypothetical protein
MSPPFTDRARKIMESAFDEAQRLRHEQVDSGHLLLGLIDEGSGVAAHVLKDLGVNLADARREIESLLLSTGPGTAIGGNLSYAPSVKNVLQYAMEEASALNHNYVGSEHLLLGMLHDGDGFVAQVLGKAGLEPSTVRAALVRLMGSPHTSEKQPTPLSLVSAGPLGRAFFGLCAFLTSLVFGAFAAVFAVHLATVRPPPAFWKTIFLHVMIDGLAVISIFMLLGAISFWTGGARWTDRLLSRIMPKLIVAVGLLGTLLFGAVGIGCCRDPGLRILGVLILVLAIVVFIALVAVPIINLIRTGEPYPSTPATAEDGSLPVIEFEEPHRRAFRFGLNPSAAGYRNRAVLCRRLLFAACALAAVLGVGLGMADILSPVILIPLVSIAVCGGALTWWLGRHARFCRECGASTKTAAGGRDLTFCPVCYHLIDPAQAGVFDVRTKGYWDRRETVPQFLAVITVIAIHEKARQVKFEPTRSSYEIDLSIGDETCQMTPAPVFIQFAAAQIVKAMAGLDMKTCDRSQEGHITILTRGRTIAARVVVEPSEYGQRVVLGFLDSGSCREMA